MKTINNNQEKPIKLEKIQTGLRMEKRLIKVLKAVAECHDLSLGELLESIVLHAFDDAPAFDENTLKHITQLKEIYGLNYDRHDSGLFQNMHRSE